MASGYIIGFAPDENQPMNYYWNGTATIPVDSTVNPQDAAFYADKTSARTASAQLQLRYPAQVVQEVTAERTIVLDFPSSPKILAPLPPPASPTPQAAPATTP